MSHTAFTKEELRSLIAVASVFALRMFGLFLIYPVFSVYAKHMPGGTPVMIGLAVGIYGLLQALLQIPFGMASDKFGRKPVILFGLGLFAAGSLLASIAHNLSTIVVGRALQGSGAVGSTLIAMVADVTRRQQRTKAMAIIGMTIGVSFAVSLLLSPVMQRWFGVPGMFASMTVLALLAMGILVTQVPTTQTQRHADAQPLPELLGEVLKQADLLRLDLSIFIQHAVLTATFVALPLRLTDHLPLNSQIWFYLPLVSLSFALMLPGIILAEKYQRMKLIVCLAIACEFVGQSLLATPLSLWLLASGVLLYFTGFNCLEACLPSLISQLAPSGAKGTALGVYSTAQFLGIFCGGLLGGWLLAWQSIGAVFHVCGIITLVWLFIAAFMGKPQPQTTAVHVG